MIDQFIKVLTSKKSIYYLLIFFIIFELSLTRPLFGQDKVKKNAIDTLSDGESDIEEGGAWNSKKKAEEKITYEDEDEDGSPSDSVKPGETITENIENISPTLKIFLITNKNRSLGEGDYISILIQNQIVVRALVVKGIENVVGIKIVKIHSLKLWNTLRVGREVQIIKGDDSYFLNSLKKNKIENSDLSKENKKSDVDDSIISEKDLFDGKLNDETDSDEKGKRAIKTDNVLSFAYGQYQSIDVDGSSRRYGHWNALWQYQFMDNVWGELIYGRSDLNAFPADGISTTLTNMTIRLKYTFNAPFYSYLQPYVGYQMVTASSPDAGSQNADNSISEEQLDREKKLVNQVEKRSVVFGISVLKRLVPGWFFRADVGLDILNVGFAFEF